MTEQVEPTLREQQLELQIWTEHAATLQVKGQLLQAQAALLQIEAARANENIERLRAILAPKAVETPAGTNAPDAVIPQAEAVAA